jgi:hypothetical protein
MTGQEIADAIEKIIGELVPADFDQLGGGINWGDLGPASIREIKTIWPEEQIYTEVLIEEADPDNGDLCGRLADLMLERHGIGLTFRTEW